MQLIAILIAVENPIDSKIYVLTRYYELSKFGVFYRNSVKDTFKFVCRESLPGLDRGTRYLPQ
jgi:synaptobrevin family protein YKT6